jgi:hypothetical protein
MTTGCEQHDTVPDHIVIRQRPPQMNTGADRIEYATKDNQCRGRRFDSIEQRPDSHQNQPAECEIKWASPLGVEGLLKNPER